MNKNINELFEKLIKGDRVSLGQAMTLVESDRPEDRAGAIQLLELCQLKIRPQKKSVRFAISGAPGVGKSTLIEAIGVKAVGYGHKVGVITIDPTSQISQGSILGDKARMPNLSLSPSAFIRSTAAGHILGGIGRRSFELMTLLEATEHDIIFLETVGVGQSEHVAWQLTDGFILVIQPGGGDELQGIKRGITELADILVINKTDGALADISSMTKSHYQQAVQFLSPLRENWQQKVLSCSAVTGHGLDTFWDVLRLFIDTRSNDPSDPDRNRQWKFWLTWSLGVAAKQLLMQHPAIRQKLDDALNHNDNDTVSFFKAEFEIEELMKDLISSS